MALDALSDAIHKKREEAIPVLTGKLTTILETLGMPNVSFKMDVESSSTYFENGKDELQFLFSANKGTDFGLLKKVASGGEMSRIMLAVKAILAQYSKLPTLIFDEIDTGVSGEIANRMGEIMKEMSQKMQIFAITHLPQIASKGMAHFKVFKIHRWRGHPVGIEIVVRRGASNRSGPNVVRQCYHGLGIKPWKSLVKLKKCFIFVLFKKKNRLSEYK